MRTPIQIDIEAQVGEIKEWSERYKLRETLERQQEALQTEFESELRQAVGDSIPGAASFIKVKYTDKSLSIVDNWTSNWDEKDRLIFKRLKYDQEFQLDSKIVEKLRENIQPRIDRKIKADARTVEVERQERIARAITNQYSNVKFHVGFWVDRDETFGRFSIAYNHDTKRSEAKGWIAISENGIDEPSANARVWDIADEPTAMQFIEDWRIVEKELRDYAAQVQAAIPAGLWKIAVQEAANDR